MVIPSFNRRDTLPEVLGALAAQREAPPFDVVVVDDGSSDGTAEWLGEFAAPFSFTLESQGNRGPAAARNRGVAIASGKLVAFLGDDTVPASGWLAAHAAAHRAREGDDRLAVIGYTRWHRRMRTTRFLEYINEHGLQFGYALIADPERVPFNFFYTSNLSLHRARLLAEPFDEGFPYPAWEDIETAYRLTRGGLRIVYEARAVVEHDHPTDFARFAARQEKAGYSAIVFRDRHPELAGFLGVGEAGPPALPGRGSQLLAEGLVRGLQTLPLSLPGLWERTLRYHYIRGLRRGWAERGRPPQGGLS